jgi:Fibronectin type III domain
MRGRPRLAASLVIAVSAWAAVPALAAHHLARPVHVRAAATGPTSIVVRWHRPAHGTMTYRVTVAGRTTHVRRGATSARIARLRPGRRYTVVVRACTAKHCSAAARAHVLTAKATGSGGGAGGSGTGSGTTTPGTGGTTPATAGGDPPAPGDGPQIGGCPVFPADNPWNQNVAGAAVDPRSAMWLSGLTGKLHPDFGSGQYGDYGIPYTVVPSSQPLVPISFTAPADEDDPGPYPVPLDARIEGGAASDGDRHVLVVQQGSCMLYELDNASPSGAGWSADFGAVFNLRSDALRPDGWTSADAAGLPILAGLARADEANAGAIDHALRFTVAHTQRAYVAPARHYASTNTDPNLPPMGMRVRLKASFDTAAFHGQALAILTALKTYGMILADNGSNWYISGTPDPAWNDDDLDQLKSVPGSAFEVVQAGALSTG